MEIGIFVVEYGNTFQFSLLWLILKALVSIKELEKNQENFLFLIQSAFYAAFRSRAIANITEANFIIQITQI